MTRRRSRLLVAAAVAGPLALVASFPGAFARPGGGQNYRSGSSGSSSRGSSSGSSPSGSYDSDRSGSASGSSYRPGTSSGSSAGGAWLLPEMSWDEYSKIKSTPSPDLPPPPRKGGLVVALVLCGLFVAVLAAFLFIGRRKKKRDLAANRPTIRVNPILQGRSVEMLKEHDASFDPAAFTARTRSVVETVNKAWLAGDMGPARRVISDGVYVRFTTQLALLRAEGLRNVMADWRVVSAELLSADADALWDTVHVKIVGAARDADVPVALPDKQVQKRVQAAPLAEYDEAWSFVRRRGKGSIKGVPALEGRCPSCGADLPLSDVVRCEYCKALVNSGEHDWVLAEITQAAEWKQSASARDIPGLSALRERDPTVSRQELEDRVSVSFWKWVEARSTGKPDKLARFCLQPPADDRARAALDLGAAGRLHAVAVGSADLKRVDTGALDRASLEVRWSGALPGQEPVHHRHTFVLGRDAAAQSKRGLSSLDCPSCGGPLATSDAVTCRYCGTALTGGKLEWALVEVRERKDGG